MMAPVRVEAKLLCALIYEPFSEMSFNRCWRVHRFPKRDLIDWCGGPSGHYTAKFFILQLITGG